MVGLNLQTVGAAPEAHLGDAPVATASPSEGIDFAGVLETMLPAGESPKPDEAATPDAPDADALGAQIATLGLPLLTLLPVQTPAVADRAVEPSLQPAPSADAPTLYAPTTLRGYAPEPAPALGAGMGDGDFTHTLTEASENLLAVEGDAPPAAARQAEPPPPSPSTTALTDASALGAPSTVPAQNAPLRDDLAPTPEPLRPREEPPTPAPAHEPRTHAHTQPTHAPAPSHETTLGAPEAAAPAAAPNWNAAKQVAQHIERMVYERERNSLTVRLDPPELGVVELRIQATGSEVQAWLTAERDLTRQMMQQAQQYLREQLESRGLHLTHFDVGAQSQFQHAPREQHTRYAAQTISTRTPTATDSLLHDGRWSVWV
jgi:hypothetical protein